MKRGILLLCAIAWLAIGCDTIRPLADENEPAVTLADGTQVHSSDLLVVNQTIDKLKAQMKELKKLEAKVAKSPKVDTKKKKELDRKIKKYGSVQILQANLRVLKKVKSDIESDRKRRIASASSE